jgi:hypothetical protein
MSTKRVVAVQLAVKLGEVNNNRRHIEDIVTQAIREHSPDMVFLPEVASAPNIHHPAMRDVVEPLDGPTLAVYRRLANQHGVTIGGGYLSVRSGDARGTYAICEPGGAVHLHDKDQPTMWENNYYAPGVDPGIADHSDGPIGVANGFEWIRTRTAERLRGRVRMVAGGMCFPSFPKWALTKPWFWDRDHGMMLDMARETPGRMARIVGVPCVQPSHVGDVTMRSPFLPGVPWPTIMLGGTQITDAFGTSLGYMAYEDGEGYICADVAWGDPQPTAPVPDRFWLPVLPWSVHAVWVSTNASGRLRYGLRKRRGGNPWQQGQAADVSVDLPPTVPAGMLGDPLSGGATRG